MTCKERQSVADLDFPEPYDYIVPTHALRPDLPCGFGDWSTSPASYKDHYYRSRESDAVSPLPDSLKTPVVSKTKSFFRLGKS